MQKNSCPICRVSLDPEQVILTLDAGASLHNHRRNGTHSSVVIAEDNCDIRCCSKTCMEYYLLKLLDKLEPDSKNKRDRAWYEIRLLWIKFDPIGVLGGDSEWSSDEYDAYVQPTLQLLDDGSDFTEIQKYISYIVKEHMWMDGVSESFIDKFVHKLLWWRST